MPAEYEALVAALKTTDIPFAEYDWRPRPEGTYGVVSLDFEAGTENGDGEKDDRKWAFSVDVFHYMLSERADLMAAVEEILTEVCGNSWELNSIQYESSTGLFHIEWAGELFGTVEATEEAGES